MAKAIRGHNLGATVALVLIAAVLLLVTAVFVARQVVTAGDRAGDNGGSSLTRDLAIERHAEVVAAYRGVVPDNSSIRRDSFIDRHAEVVARYRAGAAMGQNDDGGASVTRDPNLERHAEVVARHNRGLAQ